MCDVAAKLPRAAGADPVLTRRNSRSTPAILIELVLMMDITRHVSL